MRKFFLALAFIAPIVSAPAAAQSMTDGIGVTVRTGDLDLSNPSEQARLDRRVEYAIERACRIGARDTDSRRAEAACRADLAERFAPRIELAIRDANATRLASLDLNPDA